MIHGIRAFRSVQVAAGGGLAEQAHRRIDALSLCDESLSEHGTSAELLERERRFVHLTPRISEAEGCAAFSE